MRAGYLGRSFSRARAELPLCHLRFLLREPPGSERALSPSDRIKQRSTGCSLMPRSETAVDRHLPRSNPLRSLRAETVLAKDPLDRVNRTDAGSHLLPEQA
jgi:hypothetical protein